MRKKQNWEKSTLVTLGEVFDVLDNIKNKQWLWRGQPKCYTSIIPSIDRPPRDKIGRKEKIYREKKPSNISVKMQIDIYVKMITIY